jgi:hypothetical protein
VRCAADLAPDGATTKFHEKWFWHSVNIKVIHCLDNLRLCRVRTTKGRDSCSTSLIWSWAA